MSVLLNIILALACIYLWFAGRTATKTANTYWQNWMNACAREMKKYARAEEFLAQRNVARKRIEELNAKVDHWRLRAGRYKGYWLSAVDSCTSWADRARALEEKLVAADITAQAGSNIRQSVEDAFINGAAPPPDSKDEQQLDFIVAYPTKDLH